jgi:hypothetical protein
MPETKIVKDWQNDKDDEVSSESKEKKEEPPKPTQIEEEKT